MQQLFTLMNSAGWLMFVSKLFASPHLVVKKELEAEAAAVVAGEKPSTDIEARRNLFIIGV